MEIGVWLPIYKEPKNIKKGYTHIYSYKPTEKMYSRDLILSRYYTFEKHFGSREKDYFMVIPLVEEQE